MFIQRNNLKKLIHTKLRMKTTLNLFKFPCEVVKLDFVGADKYFITDFGAVWERSNVFPNTANILTKGYAPMVVRDLEFPYPWVRLETSAGPLWFPVNQLLGWAFRPSENLNDKYFVCDRPGTQPFILDSFKYKPEIKHAHFGEYIKFMNAIYE